MPEYASLESYIEEIKKQTNNYEQTVFALLAFANHARWDDDNKNFIPDSEFSFGRRMDPEEGDPVTPDLVVQRTKSYGLIVEAKKDLPKEQNYWIDILEQIKRYDGRLKGWFTENEFIDTYDLVLMTHLTRIRDITDFIKNRLNEGKLSFQNKFSVVFFVISTEKVNYVVLGKNYGELYNEYINNSLTRTCSVPMEILISTQLREIKFYDTEPPMPYLLQILWFNVFSSMKDDYDYDDKRKCTPIPVEIQDLTETLQKFFGFESIRKRDREIPSKSWIKKALDMLVDSKHAYIDDRYHNKYIILYKPKRGDNLEKFAKICYEIEHKPRKRKVEKQLELPI